jgi:hypothetical protein
LRGLAIAIDDKKLIEVVDETYSFFEKTLAERVVSEDEVDIRSRSLRLHTRISELLQIAMKE